MNARQTQSTKRFLRFRWRQADKIVPTLLYLAALVMFNFSSSTLFFQADLTEGKVHSLAPESIEAVSRLREPLTMRAFFSENLQSPFNNIERSVRDLLESYALHGGDLFNSTFHQISDGPEGQDTERLARDYLIYPIQVEQVDRTEVVVRSVYSGLALVHGDLVETIGALTSTDGLEMRITEAITRLTERVSVLLALEEKIKVQLFFSTELGTLIPGLQAFPETIATIVDELDGTYFNRIEFTTVDPSKSLVSPEQAIQLQLNPLGYRDQDGRSHFAYAGIVLSVSGRTLTLNLIETSPQGARVADSETIRRSVDNALKGLLGSQPEIGYLADFGTPPYRGNLDEGRQPVMADLSDLFELLSPDYKYRGLLLEKRELPPDLRTLLVVSPQERLNDWALFQIDQHLMRGGAVLAFVDTHFIYTSSGELGSAKSMQIPRQTGMEELIAHYGVKILPNYVLDDEQAFVQRQPNQRGGVTELKLPFVPVLRRSEVNDAWPPLNGLDDLMVMNASTLELTGTQPGVRFLKLLTSSKTSWTVPGRINLLDTSSTAPPALDERKSSLLAAFAEGKFTSYFADRVPPSRPADETAEQANDSPVLFEDIMQTTPQVVPESAPGARLFVIGTSTILGKGFIDTQRAGPNTLFIHNVIDYVSGKETRAALRGRGALVRRLNDFSTPTQSRVKTFLIAGPPLLVAFAGVALWLWWRLRQRTIQTRFGRTEALNREKT